MPFPKAWKGFTLRLSIKFYSFSLHWFFLNNSVNDKTLNFYHERCQSIFFFRTKKNVDIFPGFLIFTSQQILVKMMFFLSKQTGRSIAVELFFYFLVIFLCCEWGFLYLPPSNFFPCVLIPFLNHLAHLLHV